MKGKQTCAEIARSIEMDPADLILLIKRYQLHGTKAFGKGYTHHAEQFKIDVLTYMNEHGTSIRETTAIFNLSSATLIRTWKKQLEFGGIDALKSKKKVHLTMKKKNSYSKNTQPTEESFLALEARIKQLEMENEYLKKLNALVQNKEKSPNKTKHK